jgi:hypothetical protein
MSDQLSLLHPGTAGRESVAPILLARREDPEPSRGAAVSLVKHGQRRRDADRVLEWLRAWPRSTCWELAVRGTGKPADSIEAFRAHQMAARRLPDLEHAGDATCDRHEEHGRTVTATRLCSVTGEFAIEWRPLREGE